MNETAEGHPPTTGMLALVAALTLLLGKVGERIGQQMIDDNLGEWVGVIVGAGLAVVLAWLIQRQLARPSREPVVRQGRPRKSWAARRRD